MKIILFCLLISILVHTQKQMNKERVVGFLTKKHFLWEKRNQQTFARMGIYVYYFEKIYLKTKNNNWIKNDINLNSRELDF